MDQLFRKQFRRLERIKNRSAYYIQENVQFLVLAALIMIAFIYFPTINFNTVSPMYYGHKTFGILIVVFIFICIMFVSKLYNIKFKKKPKKVKKVIIVEKMKNKDFCSRKSERLEKSCSQLMKKPCQMMDCCAWVKKKRSKKPECIAGKADGPIFKSDKKGKKFSFDFYYFKNKTLPVSQLI